ncbi:MAG: hypothetical protein RL085_706 [Actinomycetota bacterium]
MRLHRAWPIAAVTFLALIAAAAFRTTTSILFMPIEMEFGWTRETTSLAVSVNLVLYGVTAPFAATLMERYSIRRVAPIALLLVALGSGLTVFMRESWQLILLWGVFVGLGTGAIALVFGSMVANRWFKERRGLVTGIFGAAYATGQLIFLPALSIVVAQSGWRSSSLTVAAISLAIIPIFYSVFRDRPSEVGTTAFGGELDEPTAASASSHTFGSTIRVLIDASRKPAFWILAGTFFVCGWTTNGLIGAHFIPAAHDHGMPATTAAGLLALVGIFDFVGTILSGYLTDKVDSVILLVFYYGLRGLALLNPRKLTDLFRGNEETTDFVPESDEFLEKVLADTRKRIFNRKLRQVLTILAISAAAIASLWGGYAYTQTKFYVGERAGEVVIFQGIRESLGPLGFSSVNEHTGIRVENLTEYSRGLIERTIYATDLCDAYRILGKLAENTPEVIGDGLAVKIAECSTDGQTNG